MLVMMALVVSVVCPVLAQDAEVDAAKAMFAKGIGLYEAMDFTEAKSAFLKVDRSKLPEEQARQLDQHLIYVDQAAKRQAAGINAQREGRDALEANDLTKAAALFKKVMDNEFVPEEVRLEARTLAAEAAAKIAAATPPTTPVTDTTPPTTPVTDTTPPTTPVTDTTPPTTPVTDTTPPAPDMSKVAAQIRVQADKKVAEGNAALQAGNPAAAAAAFEDALRFVPGLPEARSGLVTAQTLMQRSAPPTAGPMVTLIKRAQLALKIARVEFDKAIADARKALDTADSAAEFRRAAEGAKYAKGILETNKSYFPADEYIARRGLTADLLNETAERERAWNKAQVDRKMKEIDKAEQIRKAMERRQREVKLATLKREARNLESDHKYEEALRVLEEMLRLDPSNNWATGNVEAVRHFSLVQRQGEGIKTAQYNEARNLVEMEWDRIPWYDLLTYPKDWPEITQAREGFAAGAESESEENRIVRRKLQENRPKLSFDEVRFDSVVDFMRDVTGLNIVANWNALQAAGIDKTTQVTIILTNVTNEKALKEILAAVGGVVPLAYIVDEGVIRISTKEDLSTNTATRVYDIRDLIVRVPSFPGPDLSLARSDTETTSTSGGSGLFDSGDTGTGTGGAEPTKTKAELVTEILQMIRDSIAQETWIEKGGTIGSVRELNGQLVVTQTPENHRRLLGLLQQLREASAIQVNIEARFISVNTGFLNDIGINLDFFFNIGSTLTNAGTVDPITGATIVNSGPTALGQWSSGGGQLGNKVTPIAARQGSFNWTTPTSTGVPGSIGGSITQSAMALGGTFLDDLQIDFLVRATQADSRTTLLTAPRLTLLNGQRAYVMIGQEQAYVSDLDVVGATGEGSEGTYDPEIDTVTTGTVLDVEATVSADRKYVTLTVRPQVSAVNAFNSYVVEGSIDPETGEMVGSGFIQLPTVTTHRVMTTVSVPDGGTLLLGGQKVAGEVNREMGVPILSKIPVINRFFLNRTMVRDEQTLLILVKPTIIIQREYENRNFPPA